jgi:hypothetical protein
MFLQISCTEPEIIIPKPSISVSDEMMSTWNGHIHGYITGVEPQSYHLAIYIKIDELWYSLPENEIPRTLVSIENQWFCQTLKYASRNVSQVSIFLFPNSFNAPVLEGIKSLPAKLKLLATARTVVYIQPEP